MKILIELSNDKLIEWARTYWERLKTLLNEAVLYLPQGYQSVEFDDKEMIASLMGGLITIHPEVFEVKSIRGIQQQPGWSVTAWKHEQETADFPADFVPCEEKCTRNTVGASVIGIKLAFNLIAEDWGNEQDTDEYAKELAEERKQGLI